MRFLSSIEKQWGFLAVPYLTLHWVLGQILVYGISLLRPGLLEHFLLIPQSVLDGEVWRMAAFLLAPPLLTGHPLFLLVIWYWFWVLGSELEELMGDFRYSVFMLTNILATVGLSFFEPVSLYSNAFILSSVFLAFAFMKPDREVLLCFILPVKFKWLAGAMWLSYGYILLIGPAWSERFMVMAVALTFLLFFGRDIWLILRQLVR